MGGLGQSWGQDKSPGSPGMDTIPDKDIGDARAFQHSGQLRNTDGVTTHLNLNVFILLNSNFSNKEDKFQDLFHKPIMSLVDARVRHCVLSLASCSSLDLNHAYKCCGGAPSMVS